MQPNRRFMRRVREANPPSVISGPTKRPALKRLWLS